MPLWIEICLQSVQAWAAARHYGYRFYGDEFLSLAPIWYRQRPDCRINIVTDIARLELIQSVLSSGYDRCIWIDADVLVFNAQSFLIDDSLRYGFSEEAWLIRRNDHSLLSDRRINNSVCLFTSHSTQFLRALLNTSIKLVERGPIRDHLEVGTRLLTWLDDRQRLSVISNVGLLGPIALTAIQANDRVTLKFLTDAYGHSLYAANLCHYFRDNGDQSKRFDDDVYCSIVHKLLATSGTMLSY